MNLLDYFKPIIFEHTFSTEKVKKHELYLTITGTFYFKFFQFEDNGTEIYVNVPFFRFKLSNNLVTLFNKTNYYPIYVKVAQSDKYTLEVSKNLNLSRYKVEVTRQSMVGKFISKDSNYCVFYPHQGVVAHQIPVAKMGNYGNPPLNPGFFQSRGKIKNKDGLFGYTINHVHLIFCLFKIKL